MTALCQANSFFFGLQGATDIPGGLYCKDDFCNDVCFIEAIEGTSFSVKVFSGIIAESPNTYNKKKQAGLVQAEDIREWYVMCRKGRCIT